VKTLPVGYSLGLLSTPEESNSTQFWRHGPFKIVLPKPGSYYGTKQWFLPFARYNQLRGVSTEPTQRKFKLTTDSEERSSQTRATATTHILSKCVPPTCIFIVMGYGMWLNHRVQSALTFLLQKINALSNFC
jgi:hypothetical protein